MILQVQTRIIQKEGSHEIMKASLRIQDPKNPESMAIGTRKKNMLLGFAC